MRDDVIFRIACIDGRLENLDSLSRDRSAPKSPDQLIAFSGKHRAANRFDPAGVVDEDIQR
jgi:hypothetical protein